MPGSLVGTPVHKRQADARVDDVVLVPKPQILGDGRLRDLREQYHVVEASLAPIYYAESPGSNRQTLSIGSKTNALPTSPAPCDGM